MDMESVNINDAELPDLLLTELYGNNLVAGSVLSPARPASPSPPRSERPIVPSAPIQIAPSTTAPISSPATIVSQVTTGPYKFLGNNKRQISILVQSPGAAFLPDEELSVLTKMLEACKLNMGDVALVNHAVTAVNIDLLKQQLAPYIVLLFGLQPIGIELPINFPQFKIQKYDQCTYLYSPSLEEMVAPTEASKLIKTKLWLCLKELFTV